MGIGAQIANLSGAATEMETNFTDRELCALLLTYFYKRRKEPVTKIESPSAIMPDGSDSEFHRIAVQLVDYGLLTGEACMVSRASGGYEKQYRYAKISSAGVRAVEDRRSDRGTLDFSRVQNFVTVYNPTGPVQIGNHNVAVVQAIDLLIEQVEKSSAPEADKAEAKSRIHRMLEHPLVSAVVGAVAGGVVNAASS
jgi:hypothetical protein